ncbi:MAG: hypothetical protein H5T68_11805 [Chloroflexi bacterium]|nr:hypothetical protein [Chloroflexota bacterium]
MWKKVLTLMVVVMAMLAAVLPVHAEGVSGEGSLSAQGDGIAILAGRGTVDLSGNGVLWIKDKAGNAVIQVTGEGEKKEFPDGWLQYAGFHGTAHVEGSRIVVIVAGVDIEMTARGRGRAWLWGHGSYQGSADGSGEWGSRRGVRVRLAMPL